MKAAKCSSGPKMGDLLQLAKLVDWEEEHYRRLLRLAWRQNSYMKRQDVDRLEENAAEWARHLPAANTARLTRERFVGDLGDRSGIHIPPGTVGDLLANADQQAKLRLQGSLARLRQTVANLARQNELNRVLAEFCLDLVQEESEIFKRCVLEDPAGCYGGNARKADRGPGGVLVRQA